MVENNDRLVTVPIRDGERSGDTSRRRGKHSLLGNDCSKHPSPSVGCIPETLEFEFSHIAMAWASVGRMPWVHGLTGLTGRMVGPTRWPGSRAATGPGRVSGVVPRWPCVGLGGQAFAGWGGKMRARKDGPDVVGSCLVGPALTVPRIAPALKIFANSRIRGS
jgi:hypothetical protein